VMFLIDNSLSMRDVKIHNAYAVLRQLLENLSRARIPTMAAGFTGEYCYDSQVRNKPITISIIKRFNAPFDMRTIHRCTPNEAAMDHTPDYDAVRWAAPILWQRPETKKVMIVLCDGESCVGTQLDQKISYEYPIYVQKLRAIGMHVIGFGIEANLKPVFGDDFIYVNRTNMGDAISKKLTEIISRRRVQ